MIRSTSSYVRVIRGLLGSNLNHHQQRLAQLVKVRAAYFHSLDKKEVQNCKINFDGNVINYAQVGWGPHVVFMLPGILGNLKIHTVPQVQLFDRDKFTFVTWDQPGYGKSMAKAHPRDIHDGSLREDTDLMVKFMKHLGFHEYSVMGWSGGGCSALLAAVEYPEVLRSLVVWGAWSFVDKEDADTFKFFQKRENLGGKMVDVLIDVYGEGYYIQHFGAWMKVFEAMHSQPDGGDFVSKKLHTIKCPTLIIHGMEDSLVSMKHAEFMKDNIRNSKLIKWPKAKHNVHLRYPEEFHKAVERFLLKSS